MKMLERNPWPGNVRELSHVIERAVTLCDGEWIDTVDLGLEEKHEPGQTRAQSIVGDTFDLETVTQRLVVAALKRAATNLRRDTL